MKTLSNYQKTKAPHNS